MATKSPPKLDNHSQNRTDPQRVRPSALVIMVCTVGAGEALTQALASIPKDCKASFLLLTDVRLGFTTLLAERLRSEIQLSVWQLAYDCILNPGEAYLVASQSSCEFSEVEQDGAVQATEVPLTDTRATEAPVRVREICRRAAEVFGDKCIAVLLSSLAGDSVDGLRQIKEAGGRVFCQSEATSLVADGTKTAVQNQLADEVLPLWAISGHLAELLETI